MREYRSSSTEQPPEWDATSSKDVAYHNTNVTSTPATDDTPIMYEYDVTEYTHEEYALARIEMMQQIIDTMLGGDES